MTARDQTGPIPRYTRRRWLPWAHFGADAFAWSVAIVSSWWLRYDFGFGGYPSSVYVDNIVVLCLISMLSVGVVGFGIGLYRRQWRYGSFDESIALAATMSLTGGALGLAVNTVNFGVTPRSIPVIATAFALAISIAGRSVWRLWNTRSMVPHDAEPILVVGAGETGADVVRQFLGRPEGEMRPVMFLDDDPNKSRLRIHGVPVGGRIEDLPRMASELGGSKVLIAIPSAGQALLRRLADIAAKTDLQFLTVPPVTTLSGSPEIENIRPITEEDLLGRPPSDIDTAAVAGYVTGRRVLVTGAGGSIGSELCRQLMRYSPAELVMLDRDESGLHATQLSLDGRAMLDDPNLVLADLRDRARLREIFDRHRPEVVFHAAALKHLTLLEANPSEAWKSNVEVTNAMLEESLHHKVLCFVNISTDKAADPTSVLGMSKRLTERLTAGANTSESGRYLSVRFGNVLGSRGSVLTAFAAQASKGGPIVVTDPDVSRYFMTIEEAVQLTIFAGAIGSGGDVLVLDMGAPVRIIDVANRFARRVNPPLKIEFAGLRAGEKLHEVLLGEGEEDVRPVHPLISHVAVPVISWSTCTEELTGGSVDRDVLVRLVNRDARPATV